MKCLGIIDIGNTRIKTAVIRFDHQVVKTSAVALGEIDKAFAQLTTNNLSSVLIAVSGNEGLAETIATLCTEKHIRFRILNNKGRLPFKSLYAVGQAGIDRLANVAAISADFGAPAIAVDIGTAVTMEVLDSDNTFTGGAILPGVKIQAASLASETAALPAVGVFDFPASPLGCNTIEAINVGITFSVAGAIEKLVECVRQQHGMSSAPVILTGGDAEALFQILNIPSVIKDTNLTLRGLFQLGLCQHPDLFV